MTILGVLAALSAAAAAGMRLGLPLLIVGLLHGSLWTEIPVLSLVPPQVLLGMLISWSVFELFGSKKLLGQRVIQLVHLLLSPFVGALLSWTAAKVIDLNFQPLWLLALVGGVFALLLKLVQVGWFFRLRGLPIWVIFLEDILSVGLVVFALKAPENGGLIALLLLWLAIRSSNQWRSWYQNRPSSPSSR
jgi:hypothetical protein